MSGRSWPPAWSASALKLPNDSVAACPPARLADTVVRALAAAAAAFLFGFGYAAWRAESRLAEALPPEWEGEDIAVVGVVDDLPAVSPQGTRFALAVERVLTPRAVVPPRISLAMT